MLCTGQLCGSFRKLQSESISTLTRAGQRNDKSLLLFDAPLSERLKNLERIDGRIAQLPRIKNVLEILTEHTAWNYQLFIFPESRIF